MATQVIIENELASDDLHLLSEDPKHKPELEPDALPSEEPGIQPSTVPKKEEEDDEDDNDDPFEEGEIGDDPEEIRKKTTIM